MYKKKHLFLILLIFVFFQNNQSLAQRWSVAGFTGVANYQGDLVEMTLALNETHLAGGGNVSYRYNEQWAIRGNFHITRLSGDDKNSILLENRGYSFSTPIRMFSGDLMYYFSHKKPRFDKEQVFILHQYVPYVFLGLGRTFMRPEVQGLPANSLDRGVYVSQYQPTGKVGGGLAWHKTARLTLNLEATACLLTNDYLDRVSLSGKPGNRDWYGFFGLNAQYWIDDIGKIKAPKHLFD